MVVAGKEHPTLGIPIPTKTSSVDNRYVAIVELRWVHIIVHPYAVLINIPIGIVELISYMVF